MSTRKLLHVVFSLIVILALCAPPGRSANAGFEASSVSIASSMGLPAAERDSGLYRTSIAVRNQAEWTRLERLAVVILDRGETTAMVLVDDDQLETLARLRFEPQASDELGGLLRAQGPERAWLQASLQPLVDQGTALQSLLVDKAAAAEAVQSARSALRAAMNALTAEQRAGVESASSLDDDADGLTNTHEAWWCTDPLNPDTDSDGATDGAEVQAAKDWLANRAPSYSSTGKPFSQWPPQIPGCVDDDQDSVPDLAERWDLGLNMNRESTDRDKFDDGQELFGLTYCPGSGGFCGYGALPRNEDWGVIFAEMPSWVGKPGNHPLIATYPQPKISVVPSSIIMEAVTVVTTERVVQEHENHTYGTSVTQGTTTSVAETVTWNDWQEVSEAIQQPLVASGLTRDPIPYPGPTPPPQPAPSLNDAIIKSAGPSVTENEQRLGLIPPIECLELEGTLGVTASGDIKILGTGVGIEGSAEVTAKANSVWTEQRCRLYMKKQGLLEDDEIDTGVPGSFDPGILANGFDGLRFAYLESGELVADRLYEIASVLRAPVRTTTETTGKSWGGAHTTTHEQSEEHTVTTSQQFGTTTGWSTATAVDSSHAADLWFGYKVQNVGTEYAREIADLAFNVYIGDDPNPVYTYFVAPDLGGDGKFHNYMPGEEHTYTARTGTHAVPLTLGQMKAIDLGGSVRIAVGDYSYGIDELFYSDAAISGVLIQNEDGIDDGDESIDTYLIPTWGEETVLDVLARYFPHATDADGMMTAIWTPEYRSDTPAWCVEPQVVGSGSQRTLWCKHALSTADWWNIYTNGLGDGTEGLQNTPASPGSVALFRFNKDSDLDGYSDRSEIRLGTDPTDPADYPRPELIAGVHNIRTGDHVVATLSLLNTGLYDAYGVEAVMIAPNDTITVTNNTVGGSGRVRAQKQVVVGSRILPETPLPQAWQAAGHAKPAAGGYYTGTADRTYTFTVQCANPGGCLVGSGTWTLGWNDGAGASGSLNFGTGYDSPTLLDVGALGVRLGLLSGTVANGESFTVEARTPRDTFQYDILSEPHTPPVVIVSYNDPQGNHRFALPPAAMALTTPSDDLLPFSGQMLPDPGVEIVTTGPFNLGANTTSLQVVNPTETTLSDAHLFLEFIDISGTVASEVTALVTLPPGPTVAPVAWDTADFDPPYAPDEDYIVMAFLTDYQGNILDTAGRPLSSFQEDPAPAFAMATEDETWDFGTAQQGTLLKRSFTFANTGFGDLLTYVSAPPELNVTQTGSRRLPSGDATTYEITLKTPDLPAGSYQGTITIRTSDPNQPAQTVQVVGTVTAAPCDGFYGEYFANKTLSGAPALTRCDGVLDLGWGTGSPGTGIPADSFSVRWTKQFKVHTAGTYTFDVRSDDGVRVYVDDQLIMDQWINQGFLFASGSKSLTAGEHSLRVEYFENTGSAAIRLVYGPPGTRMYPLDWSMARTSGTQGQWVEFTHTLGPTPQTLHPVKVYSQDYGTLWGVGKYATDFGAGTAPGDMFGDGRDGTMPTSGNLDNNNGFGAGTVNGSTGSTSLAVIDRHAVWRINPGDVMLIHQTQGSGAGNWELNKAVSDFTGSGTFTLANPLKHTYSTDGTSNRAQILRVPQFSTCNVTGTVTPLTAWNGTWGGIFAVMCNGTMNVTGAINANGYGFRGGVGQSCFDGQPGEGINGSGSGMNCNTPGGPALSPNAQAGGGGDGRASGGSGGGGGGHATPGGDGLTNNRDPERGLGGVIGGTDSFATMIFGGAGGGGGGGHDSRPGRPQTEAEWWAGGQGGSSGGVVFISANQLLNSGSIASNGTNGTAGQNSSGGGGGGSGGATLVRAKTADVQAVRVTALGASGGPESNGDADHGGAGGTGGVGRIRIEYCDSFSGSTNPPANTQALDCYIVEQIEVAPYNVSRINLPESFSTARTYQVQYGRRMVFSGAAHQDVILRIPAGAFTSVALDALISGVGTGNVTFKLDIGRDGTWEWDNPPQSVTNAATFSSSDPKLAAALSRYWASQGAPLTGTLEVPVRVYLSKAGQVLLTNLRVTSTGSKLRQIRLPAQTYINVVVGLTAGQSGSSDLTIAADVGDDGSVDWAWSGSATYPQVLTTTNLATAINGYLQGQSGDVDLPIRFYVSPFVDVSLQTVTATPAAQSDLSVVAADISFSPPAPVETDTVTVTATVRNLGSLASGPLTASFFATLPDGMEWYIGSAFVPSVPASSSSPATIEWNTLGFTGNVPVRVVVDPYDRVAESNETNNQATRSITILTRPDLRVTAIGLSDDEPVAGETVDLTLTLANGGQTAAAASTLSLYDGMPDIGGTLVCQSTPAVPANATVNAACQWTPDAPGLHRLYAVADQAGVVNESDEGNNAHWVDVYVGFAGPLLLDSGNLAADPPYTAETGYGVIDQGLPDVMATCGAGSAPEDSLRRDPDGQVIYRFDHLLPGHFYHLDILLRECDGAGRQESILVDGNLIDGPVDLADGQPHYLSRLLDPALYANRTISVTVEAPGADGAVVSQVNLYDIDYRYADAGGARDPQYPGSQGYGWLDGVPSVAWGTLPYQSVRVDQNDNQQRYRFDDLNPARQYQVNLTYYQGSGTGRQQVVEIDGLPSGLSVNTGDYTMHRLTATVPLAAYVGDGSIVVTTLRTNASTGAMVNEISLEELTQLTGPRPAIANVRVSNVSDTSFTVSWTTNVPTTGYVHYGVSDALGQLAYDERGSTTTDDTHHVKLENLTPGTTYKFDVLSGQAIDDNNGAHYSVTTGATLPPPGSDTVYGRVFKPDGVALAGGALVYARVCDANGQGSPGCSAWLSALVAPSNGFWYANLGQARNEALASYFGYSPAGDRLELSVEGAADCRAALAVDTANDSPVADIVLRCTIQAPLTITPGWNLLALPLQPVTPHTAQSLLDLINSQGGACSEIDRWRFGGWDAHINGLPFNDFSVELGKGYFTKCTANATWILEGNALSAGVPIALQVGWNLVSVPHPPQYYTAQTLLNAIAAQGGACSEVDRWRFGGWDAHINGLPFNDFAVEPHEGYFVKCSQPSTFTPSATLESRARIVWPEPAAPIALEAVDNVAIADVLVTNRRDVALAITWRTDQPSNGWVEYGTTPDLGQVAFDDRGDKMVAAEHHVTLTGLQPKTTIYFRIHSGDRVLDEEGKPFQTTTLSTTAPEAPVTVYGEFMQDDGAPAVGTVVIARLVDANGNQSAPLSTLVDGWGYWVLSLPEVNCEDTRLYMKIIDLNGKSIERDRSVCQ